MVEQCHAADVEYRAADGHVSQMLAILEFEQSMGLIGGSYSVAVLDIKPLINYNCERGGG